MSHAIAPAARRDELSRHRASTPPPTRAPVPQDPLAGGTRGLGREGCACGGGCPRCGVQTFEAGVTIPDPSQAAREAGARARGFSAAPGSDELLRGQPFGEMVGDVARPVGTALGNLFGGLVGAVTGISISTTTQTGPTWSPNGVFDWQVGFNTSGRSGWLVQEINNGWRGSTAAGAAVANPFAPQYWEAWAVDASGAVSPAAGSTHDFWTNGNLVAGTGAIEGHWSTTGAVYFTQTDPATQGFIRNNPNTNAGGLLSSTTQPAGLGLARLYRFAQGVWDSTGATHTHSGRAGPR